MILTVPNAPSRGLVADVPPQKIPLEAWSSVLNIAFLDGSIQAALSPSTFASLYSHPLYTGVFQGDRRVLAVATMSDVMAFDYETDNTAAIVSRVGGYTGGSFDYWNGSMFNGFGILNNGVDAPQVWNSPATTVLLADLPAWPAAARCKILRPFSNFLVAMDVTKSGVRDRRMVKWSHSADPNTLPSSWNEADPTLDAGELSLIEGKEELVDSLPLGDSNILYSEAQTWSMRYVGGATIFAFRNLFRYSGLLAQGCVQPLKGGHFVVSQDDILLHDGNTIQSLADASVRNWFFNNLDPSTFSMTRVLRLAGRKEMWICFPAPGNFLNRALVWNWKYNTWSVHDLGSSKSAAVIMVPAGADPDAWGADNSLWNTETTSVWGFTPPSFFHAEVPVTVTEAGSDGAVIKFVPSGSSRTCVLEHTGISYTGPQTFDEYTYKELTAVRPSVRGEQIFVEVGFQGDINDDVTWCDSGYFSPGIDTELSLHATGRYLAVRFSWDSLANVTFFGYSLEINLLQEGM